MIRSRAFATKMNPLQETKSVRLSLVIPTYNERQNIETLVKGICHLLEAAQYRFEIIVVDDDSPDGTWEVAGKLVTKYPMLRVIRRINERGLAQAVLRGWQEAEGEILAVMDGDLQHPPDRLTSLVKVVYEDGFDIAVASRHIEGGGVSRWNAARRGISWCATVAATWILPGTLAKVRDPMSGYFALRRSVIEDRRLNPVGYKILLEVLARGQYQLVKEIPYTFVERDRGNSKFGPRQTIEYIIHLACLWWATGELGRFVRYCIVGGLGLFVNMGSLAALTWNGLGYLASGILAVEIAILTNFLLNEFWVFRAYSRRTRSLQQKLNRFFRFNLFCAAGAAIHIGVLWVLTDFLGVYYMLSNLFGIAGATLWNYGTNANFTWQPIRVKDKARGEETADEPEVSRIRVGDPVEQTSDWNLKGPTPSTRRLWPIAASLWLQLMVIIFVVVETSRIKTPIADWVNKALRLISGE